MPAPYEGGCACGAVRYRITVEPLMMFKCHCVDCQKASGGPFNAAMRFPVHAVTFTKRKPTYYSTPSTAGGRKMRGFCSTCGSRLTSGQLEDGSSPFITITVSSVDDPSVYQNRMHVFVSQKQPWDLINDGLPQHETYPPQPAPVKGKP